MTQRRTGRRRGYQNDRSYRSVVLRAAPLASKIESFSVVRYALSVLHCSRATNWQDLINKYKFSKKQTKTRRRALRSILGFSITLCWLTEAFAVCQVRVKRSTTAAFLSSLKVKETFHLHRTQKEAPSSLLTTYYRVSAVPIVSRERSRQSASPTSKT